jgi:ubiquinone/menaquinone biosynthesis C-methylase UbiE
MGVGTGTGLDNWTGLTRLPTATQWIGIDISPTACRVTAKRLKDVCGLREGQQAWLDGKGFIVEDLPSPDPRLCPPV